MTSASPVAALPARRPLYTGALVITAVLAALAAAFLVILVQGAAVVTAWQALINDPAYIQTHAMLVAEIIAWPALCGALAALTMMRLIWVIRVTRYMRFLRIFCTQRLRRDAPLVALGIYPAIQDATEPQERGRGPRLAADQLAQTPQALLLGAPGAGKTTALYAYCRSLASRSVASRVVFGVGRERLPVLISLPGLALALPIDNHSPVPYIAMLLARMGTDGLAARADHLLRKGRLTLLCDDYDKLNDDERDTVNRAIALLRTPKYAATSMVIACETTAHAAIVDDLGPVAQFQQTPLLPIPLTLMSRMLSKRRGARTGRRRERRGEKLSPDAFIRELHARPLSLSLGAAALAAALTETMAAGESMAWGRAELLNAYLNLSGSTAPERDLQTAGVGRESSSDQQPALVWAALAASLQEARSGFLPLDPALTLADNVQEWLTSHPAPLPTDFALSRMPELSRDRIERDIQSGIRTGMLRRSLDGFTLSFSHSLALAAAAAWWLDNCDDGLGRLNSQLLRPHWALPVALWTGAQANPTDLAQRIFRFAMSPSSIAPRAGLMDSQNVYPRALALAIASVVEGAAPQLSRIIAANDTNDPSFNLLQQGLRDLLDHCAIYGADASQRARLTRALDSVQQEVGDIFVAYLGRLARVASLDRLLRAQLATVLGLTATREAVEELMALHKQTDPIMRQAVEQALVYAGSSAIPALQTAARNGDAQARRRAEETLRLLTSRLTGGTENAAERAMEGLNSPDAAQRRVSVATLSAIGASGALNDLIARLDDTNGEVRLAAAAALGQLGGKRALLALRQRAKSDDANLRLAVAQALGLDPAPASTPTLLRLLKDRDARVRAAAASALGLVADKRAVGPLREASEDVDPWVRHAAQSAVRRYTRS